LRVTTQLLWSGGSEGILLPKTSPLFLLVKTDWRLGESLTTEEGKVTNKQNGR